MRVLVLSYETPSYPGAGGPSRLHALLEPLATRHMIRVVSTGGPPPFGLPPKHVDVRLIDAQTRAALPDLPWLGKNARHYAHGPPWLYSTAQHHVDALGAVLEQEIAGFRPDLIQIEHEELVPLLYRLPPSMPVVLALHNVLLEVQWQNLKGGTAWSTTKALLELPVLVREERRAVRRATRTVVVSEPNRRLVRFLTRSDRLDLVPNCVDLGYFSRSRPRAQDPTIVLTGSFHYPPNQEAARAVVAMMPAVRRAMPRAELRIVGQRIPQSLAGEIRRSPGVTVVGSVPDMRPELERAWLATAPLHRGSGSPLKVLEALAMETPVVGTPRVAASLGFGEREGLVPVRRDAMAEAIIDLLRDEPRRARLARAGRAAVQERFDHRRASAELARTWMRALTEQ